MSPISQTTRSRLTSLISKLHPRTASRAVFAMLDQAVISGVSFLTSILVGRNCTEAQFGLYTLGMSVILLAISVQQSLISAPHTIFVARYKDQQRTQYNGTVGVQALILNLIILLAIAIPAIVLMTGVGPEGSGWVMLTLLVVCPAVLLREFARRFMFAHFNMPGALFLDIAIAILQIACLAILFVNGWLTGITGLIAIGIACSISGLVWISRSRSSFHIAADQLVPETKRSWSFGKWIFGGQVSVALVAVVLNWWLAGTKGTDATGIYGACMTLILLANPFVIGLQNMLSPNVAKAMHEGGRGQVRKMVLQSSAVLGVVMAVYLIAIGLWGDEMVQLIYRGKYAGNQTPILFLGMGAFCLALGVSANHGLRAIERPEINFYAAGCGLIVATIVAILLIPGQGVLGATISYFSAMAVTAIVRTVGFYLVSGPGDEGGKP